MDRIRRVSKVHRIRTGSLEHPRPELSLNEQPLLWVALLLLASKALQLVLDHRPLLFPDSGSFITNALKLEFRPERSYVYSWLIRGLCLPLGSLAPLVVVQAVLGGVVASLLAWALIRYLEVRWQIAAAAAFAFAWDPTQVAGEHLVMTEAAAGFVAALFLITALEYLRAPSNIWLIASAILGMFLVGLRLVYLPLVVASALIVPLAPPKLWRNRRRMAVAFAVSAAAVLICQATYQRLIGFLAHREPAYEYRTGFFLAGNLAPLLEEQDAPDPQTAAVLRDSEHRAYGLSDASSAARNFQLWDPNGLVSRLTQAFHGDWLQASSHAEAFALHAVRRNPLGFLRLAYRSWTEYRQFLRRDTLPALVRIEDGADPAVQPSDERWRIITAHFPQQRRDRATERTLTRRYHAHAWMWCWMQYLAPFLGLAATCVAPARVRLAIGLLTLWSALLIAVTCLTTPAQVRYLHPLSFTGLAAVAVLAERLLRLARFPVTKALDQAT